MNFQEVHYSFEFFSFGIESACWLLFLFSMLTRQGQMGYFLGLFKFLLFFLLFCSFCNFFTTSEQVVLGYHHEFLPAYGNGGFQKQALFQCCICFWFTCIQHVVWLCVTLAFNFDPRLPSCRLFENYIHVFKCSLFAGMSRDCVLNLRGPWC